MLWECPAYDTIRNTFMKDLDNLLSGRFEEFTALNNFERTGFGKLYGNQDGNGETSGCFCSCPLTGDPSSSACVCGCVVDGVSATAAT